MKGKKRYILAFAVFLVFLPLSAQEAGINFRNQISGWSSFSFTDPVESQAGIRYIPLLQPWWKFGKSSKLDADISVNSYGNISFTGMDYDTSGYGLKPYRLWLRYSTNRLEIRAGLQKINFGSANILRPLMWFDKMDFRDPLQLTDGVYGLLGRYYFSNNANIWLWALYGNDKPKGWEITPSVADVPEYGGRIQFPFPRGEVALSYHHRVADYTDIYAGLPLLTEPLFDEDMMAFDGKWDIGIGLWVEYVRKLNDKENQLTSRWESYYNVGMDYTFSVGNGLNFNFEFFRYENHPGDGQVKAERNLSTAALSYPISLSHNISGMVYYNIDTEEWYRLLSLQLKYDHLSFHIMTYWNPENSGLYTGREGNNLFTGKGIQLMMVLDI